MDDFCKCCWMFIELDYFDFFNVQILFIGELFGVDKVVELQEKDKKEFEDVFEELEEEDLERMKYLGGDDLVVIFKDFEVKVKDYLKLQMMF